MNRSHVIDTGQPSSLPSMQPTTSPSSPSPTIIPTYEPTTSIPTAEPTHRPTKFNPYTVRWLYCFIISYVNVM